MMGDEGPDIHFDLMVEFYLVGRDDPTISQMEISIPAMYVKEMGIDVLMEHCLDDFMAEVNQKVAPFIVMRSGRGMRQVFWADAVQAVTLHAPDRETLDKLIEEAVNNG